MPTHNRIKLITLLCITAALTIVCSSGYITPASLTATAAANLEETSVPTAYFVVPTNTPTPFPTPTDTPDQTLATPTPKFETPTPLPSLTPTEKPISADTPLLVYFAQAGDTLAGLANRFGVHPFEIVSAEEIPEEGFIDPDQMLVIPQRLILTTSDEKILPDSAVVYSPSAIDFDTETYVEVLGGHLSTYREYHPITNMTEGSEILQRVALESSINPRLLLSLLEYNSHWVLGQPQSLSEKDYPMGHISVKERDLYQQLHWAATQISIGYYKWREGNFIQLEFKDGSTLRLAPTLNAGTVSLMYYFSLIMDRQEWETATDPNLGFLLQHNVMFGDAWARAAQVEPLFPPGLTQPFIVLPFTKERIWAYTGGPHGAWAVEGSQAALDFAPGGVGQGCATSLQWVVASTPGVVARVGTGVLMLDLDGDGKEQTGWVLFYLHIEPLDSMNVGKWVEKGDLLGHPSCEGGRATGTHLHIARKFNGEWIAADGPIPFELNGWRAHAGAEPYDGTLTRGDEIVIASQWASFASNIKRSDDDL
jgi:murein DD-endopeptidase MepM/ murein hydrolase activator NlpD